MTIESMVRDAMGWLHVLVACAGMVVCIVFRERSRFAWLLMAGFAGDAAVSVLYRLLTIAAQGGAVSYSALGPVYMVASLFGFTAQLAVVGGVAGILSERTA